MLLVPLALKIFKWQASVKIIKKLTSIAITAVLPAFGALVWFSLSYEAPLFYQVLTNK